MENDRRPHIKDELRRGKWVFLRLFLYFIFSLLILSVFDNTFIALALLLGFVYIGMSYMYDIFIGASYERPDLKKKDSKESEVNGE